MINTTRTATPPASLAACKKYNDPDVIEALRQDFRSKCYLCEKPITIREQSVDHRRPRARFPELKFVWTNLFPSCRDCNERRPEFPEAGLLDPCCDDVEARVHQSVDDQHVLFAPRDPTDHLAAATASELDHLHNGESIKAADLRAAIHTRIDDLLTRILEFHAHGSTTRGPVRAAWEDPLCRDFSRGSPFTALVRARLGTGFEHLFD